MFFKKRKKTDEYDFLEARISILEEKVKAMEDSEGTLSDRGKKAGYTVDEVLDEWMNGKKGGEK